MPLIPERKKKKTHAGQEQYALACAGEKKEMFSCHPDAHKPTKARVLQDERQEDSVNRFIQDSPSAASGSVLHGDEKEEKRT